MVNLDPISQSDGYAMVECAGNTAIAQEILLPGAVDSDQSVLNVLE